MSLITQLRRPRNGFARIRNRSVSGSRVMNKNPFPPKSKIKDWNAIQFKTVCTLTVDESIMRDDIMEFLVPALGDIGLIKLGDKCEVTKVGDTWVVSKSCSYMDLGIEGKGN